MMNETLNLKQTVDDLESLMATVEEVARSKEKSLEDQIGAEQIKCKKLQEDIKAAEDRRYAVKSELEQVRLCEHNAKIYFEQVKSSTENLSKATAADRQWLDAEVSRRAQLAELTRQKRKSELEIIKRRGTAG